VSCPRAIATDITELFRPFDQSSLAALPFCIGSQQGSYAVNFLPAISDVSMAFFRRTADRRALASPRSTKRGTASVKEGLSKAVLATQACPLAAGGNRGCPSRRPR
jgi:hypothetical protein